MKPHFRICVHGGASESPKNQEKEKRIHHALKTITEVGARALVQGKKAEEVVELCLFALESHPEFNAGKIGGFPSELGDYNLDASIMKSDLSYAAVAGVSVDHPISLVANLMKGMKHPFRTFYAVDDEGNPTCIVPPSKPSSSYVNEKQSNLLLFGTVGCVVLDQYNTLCAGSSTAGLNTRKKPSHRFCDVAMLGSGLYCNDFVGITASGVGEDIVPHVPAFHVYALMKYGNLPLQEALHKIVTEIVPTGTIGLIAIDRKGQIATAHNTQAFFVHSISSENYIEGISGDIKYFPPEFLYNPKGHCPVERERLKADPINFCPFETIQNYPVCEGKKEETILSPCGGNVVCVDPQNALITIFISATVKHEIFSPISGKILRLEACNGQIHRPELLTFTAIPLKNGRLAIVVQGDTCTLHVWFEVGKSWITDEIFLLIKEGDVVRQGQKIGELKLGSLAEIHFPKKLGNQIHYEVQYGQSLIPAQTRLALVKCQS